MVALLEQFPASHLKNITFAEVLQVETRWWGGLFIAYGPCELLYHSLSL